MVLESTIVCVDNSDYMRNGDFLPTRLQAQQDAVNLICHSKTRANPENNVALLTLANTEVLVTLTADVGRILARLHQLQPKGEANFTAALRVAHLALKHRLGKNHRMRIIVFVGSPVEEDEKDLVKLAKRLKKEKVNIDIINFGEESVNSDKLTTFVNTVNGKDGSCSHLVTVPPGPRLSDALVSSPIVVGEDGKGAVPGGVGGFDYGVDPSEDPELAMALRISMEEQRARQEQEVIKASTESAPGTVQAGTDDTTNEEALLKQALDISMQDDDDEPSSQPPVAALDFDSMSEDQQIAYAMQMSLQPEGSAAADSPNPMETDEALSKEKTEEKAESKDQDDEDYSEVINDPEFLQSVLENLPGVDPQSDVIRNAMGQLTKMDTDSKKDTSKKDEKK